MKIAKVLLLAFLLGLGIHFMWLFVTTGTDQFYLTSERHKYWKYGFPLQCYYPLNNAYKPESAARVVGKWAVNSVLFSVVVAGVLRLFAKVNSTRQP